MLVVRNTHCSIVENNRINGSRPPIEISQRACFDIAEGLYYSLIDKHWHEGTLDLIGHLAVPNLFELRMQKNNYSVTMDNDHNVEIVSHCTRREIESSRHENTPALINNIAELPPAPLDDRSPQFVSRIIRKLHINNFIGDNLLTQTKHHYYIYSLKSSDPIPNQPTPIAMPANPKIKAVFFDFMGTCLDWHTSVISTLPSSIPSSVRSNLALEWRQDYFDSNASRLAANKPPENIDITLYNTLTSLLSKYPEHEARFDEVKKRECVEVWHSMRAWEDVPPAITALRKEGYEVFVFANGTSRLQLDLCKSSGLEFDMLFSSQLLGVYKPAAESYIKTLELVNVKPEESVMVAAHAYDTRGAKEAGMRTVYIRRWTDDIKEDMDVVRTENDTFLEDMKGLVEAIRRL